MCKQGPYYSDRCSHLPGLLIAKKCAIHAIKLQTCANMCNTRYQAARQCKLKRRSSCSKQGLRLSLACVLCPAVGPSYRSVPGRSGHRDHKLCVPGTLHTTPYCCTGFVPFAQQVCTHSGLCTFCSPGPRAVSTAGSVPFALQADRDMHTHAGQRYSNWLCWVGLMRHGWPIA